MKSASTKRKPSNKVEDNDLNRKIAVGILEQLGIKGLLARDGSEMLDLSEKEHELSLPDLTQPRHPEGRMARSPLRALPC